jgi:hypothetical protein
MLKLYRDLVVLAPSHCATLPADHIGISANVHLGSKCMYAARQRPAEIALLRHRLRD